jgi:tetratricopeptide (TPR) repeat protein
VSDADALAAGLALARARMRSELLDPADALLLELAEDPRWRDVPEAQVRIRLLRAEWWIAKGDAVRARELLALEVPASMPPTLRLEHLFQQASLDFSERRTDAALAAVEAADALIAEHGLPFDQRAFDLRLVHGNALIEAGRLAEAEAVFNALATAVDAAFGENSLSAVAARVNVVPLLLSQGSFTEAEALSRTLLARVTGVDGGAVLALNLRGNLASALFQSGRAAEGVAMLDALVADLVARYGATAPETLVQRFNRVEALNNAGRHREALDAGTALREDMVAMVGAEHPFTLETDDAIGYALTALGRAGEAEAIHRRTLARKTAVLGADNSYTLLSTEYLARALLALGKVDEAVLLLRGLVEDRIRVLGAEHPAVGTTRRLLASAG